MPDEAILAKPTSSFLASERSKEVKLLPASTPVMMYLVETEETAESAARVDAKEAEADAEAKKLL